MQVLKKVLSSGRDGHRLKHGGELSHYYMMVDELVHGNLLHSST